MIDVYSNSSRCSVPLSVCVCACVRACVRACVCTPPFFPTRLSNRNQVGTHIRIDYGADSNLNKFDPPYPREVPGGILGGKKCKSPGNVMNCPENP